MRDELTQKQRTFAHAWIENGGNDYQAAIDAGYSQATAKNARKNILEKRGVKEYIAKLQADLDKEKGFRYYESCRHTAETVDDRHWCVARFFLDLPQTFQTN